MIYKLKGKIDEIGDDYVIIDVSGVCYKLSASTKSLSKLPTIGEDISMLTELQIKDEQMLLLGFLDEVERNAYRLLITVQGVGTKVAMAILSVFSPNELSDAIIAQDKAMITRTPGIGPRVASRLITELKDRFYKSVIEITSSHKPSSISNISDTAETITSLDDREFSDAISALTNLGYSRVQALNSIVNAKNKLKQSDAQADINSSNLIKEGLKELANE